MISKDRLEELIEEGATIYCLGDESVYPIRLNERYNISEMYFSSIDVFEYYVCYKDIIYRPLSELYETQKQAEWHLKYHRTRTEELDLPMWEDVKDIGFDYIFFVKKGDVDFEYYFLVGEQDNSIQIMSRQIEHIMLNYGYNVIYNKKLTEENYIEACDLCLKLFNGEEI